MLESEDGGLEASLGFKDVLVIDVRLHFPTFFVGLCRIGLPIQALRVRFSQVFGFSGLPFLLVCRYVGDEESRFQLHRRGFTN